jgi:hypothetical protein
MKLTKVEVNEGIKLSEVKYNEWIYQRYGDYINSICQKKDSNNLKHRGADNLICIIRDNKVINIIQDEEYNNDKPYVITKKGTIIGLLFKDKSGCEDYKYFTEPRLCGLITDYHNGINCFIDKCHDKEFEVYKQE